MASNRTLAGLTGLGVLAVTLWCGLAAQARAGEADVVKVEAQRSGATWTFDVTVAHGDTGWEHYADKWDIVAPDGTVLGTRVLYHPHESEQPFTRSLGGVAIPDGIGAVTVRAHDKVHGYGGAEVVVRLAK